MWRDDKMKQMQILNEAIAHDENEVSRIKKMLFNAEGQLKVHRHAKHRLIGEIVGDIHNPVIIDRKSVNLNRTTYVRVTEENCFHIGAEINDEILIISLGDKKECECKIVEIDIHDTNQPYRVDGCTFGHDRMWPHLVDGDIELYLIKDIE